jgi:hypothetical protein
MYTLQSNDCLIKNSRANHGRHNFDFKYPYSNGNVIHNCLAENSKYASDFHMYLSIANLFDACTVNGDYLESAFRPYGGGAIHGYTSTQSVFYNTTGEAYHPNRDYIVESRQFGWGYIIGTSGQADQVITDPVTGSAGGYSFNTAPEDFAEGIGEGNNLKPWSLYHDQLYRRLRDDVIIRSYTVAIQVLSGETKEILPGCQLVIYSDTVMSDASGRATFYDVPETFIMTIEKELYFTMQRQMTIHNDTSLTVYLTGKDFDVTFKVLDAATSKPFWGAVVTLGLLTATTGEDGEVELNVYEGSHNYVVSYTSYKEETGTLIISSDTTVLFHLIRTHAEVKFRLKDGTTPVNKAIVKIDGDSLMTNSLGIATFKELPVGTGYSFFIRKHGYFDTTGTIFLTTDTIIQISLEAWPDGIDIAPVTRELRCWPNPVNDFLFCVVPDIHSEGLIRITDLNGEQILDKEVDNSIFSVDVGNYPPGLYLLKLISGERQHTTLFIKN